MFTLVKALTISFMPSALQPGVLAVGLDEQFHHVVAKQFEDREVQKTYLAVVHGRPDQDEGTIDYSIGPDQKSAVRLKLAAHRDGSGMPALTHYRVLRGNDRYSLVELRPKTGRTHQLRVHMTAIGCPLVGDKIYGADDAIFLAKVTGELDEQTLQDLVLPRHALHSSALRFYHPMLDREMVVEAPLPDDMRALVD